MKTILAMIIFFGLVPMSVLNAQADVPVETIIQVKNVYSPDGFDSNDNVEVIVEGYLPNPCHKSPKHYVDIRGNKINIKITALHYDETSPFCPQMIVPFIEPVSLGILKKGQYDIVVNGGTQLEMKSEIEVAQAKAETIDDFIYGSVEFVQVVPGTRKVAFHGYQPSDCIAFDKIEVKSNGKDTYSVLPKMVQVSHFCPLKRTPFYAEWEVPSDINRAKVLLHIRVLDGRSINFLYE